VGALVGRLTAPYKDSQDTQDGEFSSCRSCRSLFVPLSLPLAAVVLLAASVACAKDSLREELHYLTTYHGEVIGTKLVRVYDTEFEGRPAVRTETTERTRFKTHGVRVNALTRGSELTDAEGLGIELSETRTESSQVKKMKVKVADDSVVIYTSVAGVQRARRFKRDGPVRFDLDGRAFALGGTLEAGRKLRSLAVARVEHSMAELEAEVLGEVALPEIAGIYGTGSTGWRIRVSNAGGLGSPWEYVVDREGRTVEMRIPPFVMRRVRPEEARLPRRATYLENRFRTERLTKLESVRTMKVEAAVPGDVPDNVFPGSIYGEAQRGGDGKFTIALREARPDGRIARHGLSDEERARFLGPSQDVESDVPLVMSLARKIALDEKEPLKVALLMTRWVYRNLAKRNSGPATATALEALKRRAGDCTEHAALLAALLRASGMPARQVMGLVHDGTGFQFHAWAEVYAEDRWVPLDPTLGRVGVPAIYVLLGREGDLVEYHTRANALQGRMEMRIVEERRTGTADEQ